MIRNEPVLIYGDGETCRDFCYVSNVVQANLLAATTANPEARNQVYNVAVNARTSLNTLFNLLRECLASRYPHVHGIAPRHEPSRPGDIRHSQADIAKAAKLLRYAPTHTIKEGLVEALGWYVQHLS